MKTFKLAVVSLRACAEEYVELEELENGFNKHHKPEYVFVDMKKESFKDLMALVESQVRCQIVDHYGDVDGLSEWLK